MSNIFYTIPAELAQDFEEAFYDWRDEGNIQKLETTIDDRQYYVYQQSIDSLYKKRLDVVDELNQLSTKMYIKGFGFDIEVKLTNKGLRQGLTNVHVFNIDADNPKCYVCAALEKAFTPIEHFTNTHCTQIGFKRTDEFVDAVNQLSLADKPTLDTVAYVDESKIRDSDKAYLDESTIETMIAILLIIK